MQVPDTKEKIMQAARKTVQAHGYNALSFRDLAAEVGIKSASVHYHFPTKGDLGAALARRYTDDGSAYLKAIDTGYTDQRTSMQQYTDIFRAALADDNRMCLVGIMAAEHENLPLEVRAEVSRFNQLNIGWLSDLLARAPSSSTSPAGDRQMLRQRALGIFAAIEGAQLVARGQGDIAIYDSVVDSYVRAGLIP